MSDVKRVLTADDVHLAFYAATLVRRHMDGGLRLSYVSANITQAKLMDLSHRLSLALGVEGPPPIPMSPEEET